MAIAFGYAVKYNGKYYPPNTPIEEAVPKAAKVASKDNIEPKPDVPKRTTRGRIKGDA